MTCIAWDGRTLAADRQSTDCGLRRQVTKIRRAKDGNLMGAAGTSGICAALRDWYDAGAKPDDFPDKEKTSHLLVVSFAGVIRVWDGHPTPTIFEVPQLAMGSGRDYAEAAMYLGKTAEEAVAIACHFDNSCGGGIDTLEFETTRDPGGASQPETGEPR